MNCDRASELIGAYRDGELLPDERRDVAAHIAVCRACREMAADNERIGRALRSHGRVPAPPTLAPRIAAGLDRVDAEPSSKIGLRQETWQFSFSRQAMLAWGRQAGALVAVCLLSVAVTWWMMSGLRQSDQLEREILSAHVRSLLQESAVQVASSDRHIVRPWFAGRIDFAPAVKDLKAEGFPLVGGRLDYIGERRVGALVYRYNLHVINVFLWPAAGPAEVATHLTTRNGYNLLSWTRAGVAYWAASDLNPADLEQLSRLL